MSETSINHRSHIESIVSENDLAMVLYTSGTTGKPKGVMLSHKNILANTKSIVRYLNLTENDCIVNILPFFYSFGNSILMTHLGVQARIVIENRFVFPSIILNTIEEDTELLC